MKRFIKNALTIALLVGALGVVATAQDAAAPVDDGVSVEMFTVNNVWMMVATFLVFIMHLGFATLECGLTRAKNTVNILSKNIAIISIGLLTYWLCGFNLMYPDFGDAGATGFLKFGGFFINLGDDSKFLQKLSRKINV